MELSSSQADVDPDTIFGALAYRAGCGGRHEQTFPGFPMDAYLSTFILVGQNLRPFHVEHCRSAFSYILICWDMVQWSVGPRQLNFEQGLNIPNTFFRSPFLAVEILGVHSARPLVRPFSHVVVQTSVVAMTFVTPDNRETFCC